MPRSALILSCALHGSVLAMVGWSTLLVAPRAETRKDGMSVSISLGETALVAEEPPAPQVTPEIASAPAEKNFTPPAPTIEPAPTPVPVVESAPPSIRTTAEVPRTMPSIGTAKPERVPRNRGGASRKSATVSSGEATGMSMGGGGGSGYIPPQFLTRYKPPYPEQARAQRLEGVVLLRVSVDTSGRVTDANIHQGSGHAILDRAALEAVRTWRFTPARQGDRVISATVELPIRFHFSA
ncbi:MAG TPA: energy transducer TonB [Chthoniobacter sp.]|nr:energy transducer TonB [Chthoniobacter sp.]